MNTFVLIIITLLILSIANNFLMYNKCYVNKNVNAPTVSPNIALLPINIYYLKSDKPNDPSSNIFINDLKAKIFEIENNNKDKCVVTIGEPSNYENTKIYNLGLSK